MRKNLSDLMTKRRRVAEGFRGQHLVVLPATVRRRAEKHPLLRGLMVTDAGTFPRAAGHFIERAGGAPTTLLIHCVAGRGWATIGEQTATVQAGMLVWLTARRPHAYGANPRQPWTIEWAHFSGEETEGWRELLRLPPAGGVISLASETSSQLARAWEVLEGGYSLANLVGASTALRATLLAAAQRNSLEQGTRERDAAQRVAASLAWLKEHLAESIRLNELAEIASLSVPHYSALFRQQTGFAPIDWLIRLRIQRACQLLDTTMDKVAEIARRVGFADPYHFTRCFRRIMGTPPRDYRRAAKI